MKLQMIALGFIAGFINLVAQGQTAQTPPPPPASASGTVQIQNQNNAANQGQAVTVPPGVPRMQQASPALQNRLQSQAATNSIAGTNSGFRTNTPGWNPTGRADQTNRVFGSNSNSGSLSNQTSMKFQDQVVTTTDRSLLVQIRQTVFARLQPVGAWSPAVHFQLNNGVVTLVGPVTTIQISQQIESTVTQVPGVIRVVNRLVVNNEVGSGGGAAVPALQTNATAVPQ